MDAVNPLNYSPRPRVASRVSRWAYRLLFLATLIVAAILWGPGLQRHVQFIYWQYQCLSFTQPADHVIYELAPGKIIHSEFCQPALRFDDSLTGSPVFLHEMRRPDGAKLLVSVRVLPSAAAKSRGTDFNSFFHALNVNEWLVSALPQKLEASQFIYWGSPLATGGIADKHNWKIFAGQPDVNNPSHFTFDYEVDGVRHSCDVWLNNYGQLIASQRP
jgi:hypothetical protein